MSTTNTITESTVQQIDPVKTRLNLELDAALAKKLSVVAAHRDTTRTAMIEEFITSLPSLVEVPAEDDIEEARRRA